MCRRLRDVVDSPHAWLHAFSQYFPGPNALRRTADIAQYERTSAEVRTEKRAFTRLAPVASWTSEYLLRTRLIRCLGRGKPGLPFAAPAPGKPYKGYATLTFNSRLASGIDRLDAAFGSTLNKKLPRFAHGWSSTGTVTASDKRGKSDGWGISQRFGTWRTFEEVYPGHAPWGLEDGEVVGLPNVMEISVAYGMVYGEGFPGGHLFYLAGDEKVIHWLPTTADTEFERSYEIPRIPAALEAVCSVWVAKSVTIPRTTNGIVGILCGSSSGTVSIFSFGKSSREQRFSKGALTARWILSPGVPIIALTADDNYSEERKSERRIWAVALNALGEVFHLRDVPRCMAYKPSDDAASFVDRNAWLNGRTCKWGVVSPSQRVLRHSMEQSYNGLAFYSEAISGQETPLTLDQIEESIAKRPIDFRSQFEGWDMRRRLEVDFGGDDANKAGENIVVVDHSAQGGQPGIARYRRRLDPTDASVDYWLQSKLTFAQHRNIRATTTALDASMYATLTCSEDLALGQTRRERTKRDGSTSVGTVEMSPFAMPGARSRFIAAGTDTGVVFIWDTRSSTASSPEIINDVHPLRIIVTDSPSISSLALTALYVVHGGSEGLVQAWDVLASTTDPVRTISSRNTLNARRRAAIAQQTQLNQTSQNHAAGAISLDPDPTSLRGVVAIGTWLRYWHYSSEAAVEDISKSRKRKMHRELRGLNSSPGEGVSNSRRYGLKSFVTDEIAERKLEEKLQANERKKEDRIAARFGLHLLGEGASEEEMLAYATMLSEEEQRRASLPMDPGMNLSESAIAAHIQGLSDEDYDRWQYASWRDRFEMSTPGHSSRLSPISTPSKESTDSDVYLAEAVKLSLDETPQSASGSQVPGVDGFDEDEVLAAVIQSTAEGTPRSPRAAQQSPVQDDDIEEAIRRSLQDSPGLSRRLSEQETFDNDFPALSSSPASPSPRSWGHGKGKRRA